MDISQKPVPRTDAAPGRRARALRAGAAPALALAALLAGTVHAAACGDMLLYAQRGAPDRPENSASAVEAALEGGWDGVEVDVQQLRSGEWVLNADPVLGRSTSVSGRAVRDMNAAAWREVRLRERGGQLTDEPAAFLDGVLDGVRQHPAKVLAANLMQPFANCQASQNLTATLAAGLPAGQWFMTAFDRRHLACARKLDPHGYLGLVVLDASPTGRPKSGAPIPIETARAQDLGRNWMAGLLREVGAPVGLHLDARILQENPHVLEQARELGIPVFTFGFEPAPAHVAALRSGSAAARMRPSGAIADGDAAGFCDAVKAR